MVVVVLTVVVVVGFGVVVVVLTVVVVVGFAVVVVVLTIVVVVVSTAGRSAANLQVRASHPSVQSPLAQSHSSPASSSTYPSPQTALYRVLDSTHEPSEQTWSSPHGNPSGAAVEDKR